MNFSLACAALLFFLTPTFAVAQQNSSQETRNAVLRYWMAFAEIHDLPSDKTTQDFLEKTAAGEAAWDESRLGPILDMNADAIAIFQRATKLPDCDWGVEYSQGPRASIAYAPRARVISRLNTLQGIRQMAKGQSQAAVDTWIAGIRFTDHLAKGGSLLFALIAKSALLTNLHVLTQQTSQGHLNPSQKRQILAALQSIPQDGSDWASAWGYETSSLAIFLDDLRRSPDPRKTYEGMIGDHVSARILPPSGLEIVAFKNYMNKVQAALRLQPSQAKIDLDTLGTERQSLSELTRTLIPSPQKANDARAEIISARQALEQALNKK
jgi:hypothetical protein